MIKFKFLIIINNIIINYKKGSHFTIEGSLARIEIR